jgi:RNA polymerase sigma-70 factor (ECF subfamily)
VPESVTDPPRPATASAPRPSSAVAAVPTHPASAPLTGPIARGDAGALASFYDLWFDRLYTMTRSITRRDESFCLDVVQDAMLRVVRKIRAMNTEADVERWMARVVHTTALDRLRSEARRLARERRRASREPATTPHAGTALQLTEQIAWLRARLAELPPQDRDLILMRVAEGRTLDQTGAAAGLTGDAAHGRIRRTLARLRAAAKEWLHE